MNDTIFYLVAKFVVWISIFNDDLDNRILEYQVCGPIRYSLKAVFDYAEYPIFS